MVRKEKDKVPVKKRVEKAYWKCRRGKTGWAGG